MARISEAYGDNYFKEADRNSLTHMTSLFVTNLVGRNLNFRQDNSCLWEGANMKKEAVKLLADGVMTRNNLMRLVHISKTSGLISKVFPYSINGPVEYFILIDMTESEIQLFSLYITPNQIEPF